MAAAALAVLVLAGCGGDGDDETAVPTTTTEKPDPGDPGEAAEERFRSYSRGQWQRVYALIHPAQQEILSEDEFVACMDARPPVPAIDEFEVLETFDETVTVPGTEERAESTAVTFRADADGETVEDTMHLIDVDGEWRFYLSTPQDCLSDV